MLLKPEDAGRYARIFDPSGESGPVRVDTFARLAEAIELKDPAKAHRLSAHGVDQSSLSLICA